MEKSTIYIKYPSNKEEIVNLANFVKDVFDSGKSNNMDQATIVAALNLLKDISLNNITIQDCNFYGEKIHDCKVGDTEV